MKDDMTMAINDYLPLRDVVFNTLRQAILKENLSRARGLWRYSLPRSLG